MTHTEMSAQDYPVTFEYLAKWGLYTHRGRDRAMPKGVPVIVGDTLVGYSGNTGFSFGAHLHTQAGYDPSAQETINPEGHEFKPGTVSAVGRGLQWGNYAIVKTDKVYVVYAHLSETTVSVGQKIRRGNMTRLATRRDVAEKKRLYHGDSPTSDEYAKYVGRVDADKVTDDFKKQSRYKKLQAKAEKGDLDPSRFMPTEIRDKFNIKLGERLWKR